jgi:DNA-binding CsgD family transcriptional regulator
MSNREIADTLIVGITTVKSHIYRASRRLGAHTRRAAARIATAHKSDVNGVFAASA